MRPKATVSVLAAFVFSLGSAVWGQQAVKITPVFRSSKTLTGQNLEYAKTSNPEVSVVEIEVQPGGEIGRHMHLVSGYVYVLEGRLTVELDDGSRHEFRAGQAFVEPVNTWHNAKNPGTDPVKILVVTPGELGKGNLVRPGASGAAGGASTGAASPGPRPGVSQR